MRRVGLLIGAAVVISVILVLVKGWQERRLKEEMVAIEAAVEEDGLDLDLPALEPESWVRQYQPDASAGGYSLVLYERRMPVMIDMNGRVVHVWPGVRAVGRARLSSDGRLAVIGTDNLIKEYDWEGNLRWFYRLAPNGDFPHHDLIMLGSGNYLVLARDRQTGTGYLQEVDRKGRVVWEWRSAEHRAEFGSWDRERKDPTHFNSIHELPSNRWFEAGDKRFRPGNILVSARHLDTIFIIDKNNGDVVWQHSQGLDYQHEASMVGEGDLGAGLILVFDNGRRDRDRYRRSRVLAIDPVAGSIEWNYGTEFFYSSVAGTVQKLPGQNVLITSSHGGRAFEIAPDGRIVWEWTPSYMPMRVERYPLDHCPQLAALPRPVDRPVRVAGDARPFVDADLYSFALPDDYRVREVSSISRRLLRGGDECHELLVPSEAILWAEWGLDEKRLGQRRVSARFRLSVQKEGEVSRTLIDSIITNDSDVKWHGRNVPLTGLAYERVTMCVATKAEGEMEHPLRMTAWGNPLITTPALRQSIEFSKRRITEQEKQLQKQQLEALGYVH